MRRARAGDVIGVAVACRALALIARAAEGSVRDGLSLLDQAIAMHTDEAGNINITADSVRDMLGLADKWFVITVRFPF